MSTERCASLHRSHRCYPRTRSSRTRRGAQYYWSFIAREPALAFQRFGASALAGGASGVSKDAAETGIRRKAAVIDGSKADVNRCGERSAHSLPPVGVADATMAASPIRQTRQNSGYGLPAVHRSALPPAAMQPEPLLGMLAHPALDHRRDRLHGARYVDAAVSIAHRLDLAGNFAHETVAVGQPHGA
jgi:hypothetical protein